MLLANVKEVPAIKGLRIKFQDVEILRITLEGVYMNLNFEAYNPNDVNSVLSGFEVDILTNNVRLGKAAFNEHLKIPAGDSVTFTIPIHLSWRDLSKSLSTRSLSNAIIKKSVTFRAIGYALINTPLGKLRFKVADYTRVIQIK